jgi:hypothetical protein
VTGFSRTRIFQAIRDDELTARKSGKATVIETTELTRWLRSLPTRGRPPLANTARAMIATFGLPNELDPGALTIADNNVTGGALYHDQIDDTGSESSVARGASDSNEGDKPSFAAVAAKSACRRNPAQQGDDTHGRRIRRRNRRDRRQDRRHT